jgi:hypothetical protein
MIGPTPRGVNQKAHAGETKKEGTENADERR